VPQVACRVPQPGAPKIVVPAALCAYTMISMLYSISDHDASQRALAVARPFPSSQTSDVGALVLEPSGKPVVTLRELLQHGNKIFFRALQPTGALVQHPTPEPERLARAPSLLANCRTPRQYGFSLHGSTALFWSTAVGCR
jgi:hypothetical protein